MSVSTLPLTPDPVSGVGANAETTALHRIADADYQRWLGHVHAAAACTRPVRLVGTVDTLDPSTGEVTSRATEDMPDRVIYKACGNRRKAVCPACAEVYRADAYQLVLAGLQGGKGIPESVSTHPAVFFTPTAPGFGTVHTRRTVGTGDRPKILPCRPRRKSQRCRHGADLRCNRVHDEDDPILGTPFCLDCYRHAHQVVWNSQVGELFRRTRIALNRIIARHAKQHGDKGRVRVSYGKAAEMQRRGVVHFHGIARFDGVDRNHPDEILPPPEWASVFVLAHALREAIQQTAFTTRPHRDNPAGWPIEWGEQLDIRPVHLRGDETITTERVLAEASYRPRRRTLSFGAVSGYLAKYATKSTEDTGHLSTRLTAETVELYADKTTHAGRLIDAAWRLGADPAYKRLRRWAHTLGYGGHFFTKSRRYTTTFGRLRAARVEWTRHNASATDAAVATEETRIVITHLTYIGAGWRTTGDALLANTAAALARERHWNVPAESTAS